jgi:hypothetical protein
LHEEQHHLNVKVFIENPSAILLKNILSQFPTCFIFSRIDGAMTYHDLHSRPRMKAFGKKSDIPSDRRIMFGHRLLMQTIEAMDKIVYEVIIAKTGVSLR